MKVGRLVARVVIGSLFIGHGTQKLFGWFGGAGLAGTDQMMEQLELRPARRNTITAGVTETAGGTLLLAGLATPLAAAGLIGVMITAIRKVHLPNGPWASKGGWEYNAVLIAAAVAVADAGPGEWSLDHALGLNLKGPLWALGALAAGAAGPSLLMRGGEQETAPVPTREASEQTAPTPA